jgi:uncharacterized protein involved in exopolysaccharide biosynthesis
MPDGARTSLEAVDRARLGTPLTAEVAPTQRTVDELSFLDIVNLMLRHRRLMVVLPLLGALTLGVITFLAPRTWTATASMLPTSAQGTGSRLSGLAAQFGLNVPGGDPTQSPAFYGALLASREILEPTVRTSYSFRARRDSLTGTLVELFEAEGGTPSERLEDAIKRLHDRVTVDVDRQTGLVQLKVRTEWAPLSYRIVERMLALVNEFNITRRQSQASAERAFIQEQLEQARTELRHAENQLQGFLQRNRLYANDPQLAFEHDRLQRTVSMRQDVYTTLAQAFEQARIDAVRDTPPMTVVERAHIPATPNRRGTMLRAILGLFLGTVLAIVIAVAREFMTRSQLADSPSSREFSALWSAAVADLRRLLHLRARPARSNH